MTSTNGVHATESEFEASLHGNPYSSPEAHELEEEWETPALQESHYSNPEDEWEDEWEAHESPYSSPEMEAEWETLYSSPEYEAHARARPQPAAPRPRPHAAPAAARPVAHAPRILARAAATAVPVARRLVPQARRAVVPVTHHVLGRAAPRSLGLPGPTGRPAVTRSVLVRPGAGWRPGAVTGSALVRPGAGWRPGMVRPPGFRGRYWYRQGQGVPWSGGLARPTMTGSAGVPHPPAAGGMPRPRFWGGAGPRPGGAGFPGRPRLLLAQTRRLTVAGLLRQLAGVLGEGEREATEVEASLFGVNEFETEVGGHEAAHEAALTEVLAAEAAHAETEAEAEALLGATLPITIRIMGGRRRLRAVTPTLVQANARLVRGIRRSTPAGRQLLRVVPSIQRRAVASLTAAARSGRPITPALVARVTAAQAARVLGTPRLVGRALVRNSAIRGGTVAPPGRAVRPR